MDGCKIVIHTLIQQRPKSVFSSTVRWTTPPLRQSSCTEPKPSRFGLGSDRGISFADRRFFSCLSRELSNSQSGRFHAAGRARRGFPLSRCPEKIPQALARPTATGNDPSSNGVQGELPSLSGVTGLGIHRLSDGSERGLPSSASVRLIGSGLLYFP